MGTTKTIREPIKKIEGANRVLIIAPHGVDKNDKNTNKLAIKISNKLGCYAVVNQGYKRPAKGKEVEPNRKIVNLNSFEQIRAHLMEEFLKPIVDYKNEIISKDYGNPVVVLIHGMANDNMDKYYGADVQAVIGAGIGVNLQDRHSMDIEIVNQFMKLLGEGKGCSIKAVMSDKTIAGKDPDDDIKKKYGGWSIDNLNQLFTQRNPEYCDNSVKSLQIELKEAGIRDKDASIKVAADTIANAIATLFSIKLAKKKKTANKIAIVEEPEADDRLVEETTVEITNIFCKHFGNGVVAAGKLLIDKFFDGNMALARKLNPVKKKSFDKLIETIKQGEKYKEAPSQSWLYRAVQLYVEHQDIKEIFGEEVFKKYDSLLISHQVELLPVRNVDNKNSPNNKDTKLQLINETVEKKYSVAELKTRRRELIPKIDKSLGDNYGLPEILKKDKYLLDDANDYLIEPDYLITLDDKTTIEVKGKTESKIIRLKDKIKEYEKELEEQKNKISRQDKLLKKCQKIIKGLKPVKEQDV